MDHKFTDPLFPHHSIITLNLYYSHYSRASYSDCTFPCLITESYEKDLINNLTKYGRIRNGAASNYNIRARPAEVIVNKEAPRLTLAGNLRGCGGNLGRLRGLEAGELNLTQSTDNSRKFSQIHISSGLLEVDRVR